MQTTIHRFDPTRRADFFHLHGTAHETGSCFCTAWWVESWQGWGERPPSKTGPCARLCSTGVNTTATCSMRTAWWRAGARSARATG